MYLSFHFRIKPHPLLVQYFSSDPIFFGMVGEKTSLVNFKHKIMTSANYTGGIGTGYTSHDKELCLHRKRQKNYFKINQSN